MAFARLSSLFLLLLCTAVLAQAPTRVRGTIVAFDGVTLSVQGGGLIRVDDKTQIVFAEPIALADIRPGDFLIVNGHGHTERALLGELMAEKAKKLGAVGIVVDGALRDRQDLEEMQFPAWARAVTPAGPFKNGPGKINVPVAIGGVVVTPGDLVIADDDGVIVVPASEAADTLSRARAINIDEANRRKAILEMVSE